LSVFVDTSVWYAVADAGDRRNRRAKELLRSGGPFVTSDHVLVETWILLRFRLHREAAERFWAALRGGLAEIEPVTAADLQVAWAISESFPDQDFSIVDRTSFAVMQRLGVLRALAFDGDFAIFRFGPGRKRAFEIIR
jgi:predicted nucleic acid-binding protein